MARRSRVRTIAFQVLYQEDMAASYNPADGESYLRRRLGRRPEFFEFGQALIAGVRKNRGAIDALLGEAAENWSVDRMAATDRSILRLGAYELLYTDTPDRVVIDEAVELAKRFGSVNSGPFVNGILDRLMRRSAAGQSPAADTPAEPDGGG